MGFCLYQRKWGTGFMFQKNDFWKFLKIGKHFHIFVYFIKIWWRSKESPPFLNNPPFSPIPPLWKKYFIPTLIAKLKKLNPPLVRMKKCKWSEDWYADIEVISFFWNSHLLPILLNATFLWEHSEFPFRENKENSKRHPPLWSKALFCTTFKWATSIT